MVKTIGAVACVVAFAAGLAAVDYGCSMAWEPLGLILGGLEVAAVSLFIGYDLVGDEVRKGRKR